MKDSISIITPAFNEEHSLEDAVDSASRVAASLVKEYEIIIVDDGSTDRTPVLADRLARENTFVTTIHHKQNEGFGSAFRDGLAIASKKYLTGFPADNDLREETFKDIILSRKPDRLVMTYMVDSTQRSLFRRIISICYTKIMNMIFSLELKYFNGYFICPTPMIKSLTLKSEGHSLFAEIKIKLIKKGVNYTEIPYVCGKRSWGKSKALRLKNIVQTLTMIPIIISDTYR